MKIVQGHVAIIMGYGLVVDTFYAWKCRSIVLFSKCILPLFAEERFRSGKVLKNDGNDAVDVVIDFNIDNSDTKDLTPTHHGTPLRIRQLPE